GVTDLLGRCSAVLEQMQRLGMPLLIHGEVTDPQVDIFDREAVFIEQVMIQLRAQFPELKVVFEHLTTQEGVQDVRETTGPISAEIAAVHVLYNSIDIFSGGLRPHWYCLPELKREVHRQALLDAATSGHEPFFLGTDSAPHTRSHKEQSCGCAGCFTALHAIELYAEAFERAGRLDNLEAFASRNGPAFYGLPVNQEHITLQRAPWRIPAEITVPGDEGVVPLAAGETLQWRLQA